jgi:hypothetical protein
MCGGDNCHRAAVVGSILAAAHGIPTRWWPMPEHQ